MLTMKNLRITEFSLSNMLKQKSETSDSRLTQKNSCEGAKYFWWWPENRGVGLSPSWSYAVVTAIFMLASLNRNSVLLFGLVALGVLFAFLVRMNFVDVLAVSIPFSFSTLLISPIEASASIAHLVAPLTLVSLLSQSQGKKTGSKGANSYLVVVAFTFIVMLSALVGSLYNQVEWEQILVTLLKFGYSSVFAVIGALVVSRARATNLSLDNLLTVWTLVALAVAAFGYLTQFFSLIGTPLPSFYSTDRIMATFLNPNSYAAYQIVSSFFALYLGLRHGKKTYLLLSLLLLYSAAESNSQAAHSALLVIGLVGLFVTMLDRSHLKFLFVYSFVSLATVGLRYINVFDLIKPISSNTISSGTPPEPWSPFTGRATEFAEDVRWLIWRDAVGFWIESPFLGIGLGQYAVKGNFETQLHNTALTLLIEFGVVPFLITLLCWVVLFYRTMVFDRNTKALGLGMLGLVVFGMGNDLLHVPSVWFLFGLVFGLVGFAKKPHLRQGSPVRGS